MSTALTEIASQMANDHRREKALVALAKKIDVVSRQGTAITTISTRITRMERQSTALLTLIDRLDASDRRERAMIALMQRMAEGMQRNDRRLGAISDSVSALHAAVVAKSREQDTDSLTSSLQPLESTIQGLIDRLPPAEQTVLDTNALDTHVPDAAAVTPPDEASPEPGVPADETAQKDQHIQNIAEPTDAASTDSAPVAEDTKPDETVESDESAAPTEPDNVDNDPEGPVAPPIEPAEPIDTTASTDETPPEAGDVEPIEDEKRQEIMEPVLKSAASGNLPAEVEGRATYDYDTLNRHAIENTRRLGTKSPERKKRRGLFGWRKRA